jgi:hypothetical protein
LFSQQSYLVSLLPLFGGAFFCPFTSTNYHSPIGQSHQVPRRLTKDQRYTRKKREESKRLTLHGHITDRQISIRVGDEELSLLEMWMTMKELDMTALLEEIIASLPNEVSSYRVQALPETRTGKRLAGGKPNKRICCWIRSTLHDKLNVHAKAKGLSMNRFLVEAIRNYRLRQRGQDRLSQSQGDC